MNITFNINNQNTSVEVDGNTPLLWVIRDILDLKGTKFGCGKGACGACTVHLEGVAIRSCAYPVQFAEGKNQVL
jgi:isoquinoline 1-oxidoreductase alpha subunit